MAATKTYFRDHFVLILLTLNIFLALFASIAIILKLSSSHGTNYIVQYRPSLGVNTFKTGSISEVYGFVVFALLVLLINVVLSLRSYTVHRYLAVAILCLGLLLTLLDIIVSNALLVLH